MVNVLGFEASLPTPPVHSGFCFVLFEGLFINYLCVSYEQL